MSNTKSMNNMDTEDIDFENRFWKILKFAELVGKHHNTVDLWFKKLEEKRVHYINRVGDNQEKVYDTLDLEIAQFIVSKRAANWGLDAIFDHLPHIFDLRPFPVEEKKELAIIDVEKIRSELMVEFDKRLTEKVEEMKKEFQNLLPEPIDPIAERDRNITNLVTQKTVEYKLRSEALSLWKQKPAEERMIRTGLFRKEEDRDKKDQFINEYVQENIEKRLKEAFGMQ